MEVHKRKTNNATSKSDESSNTTATGDQQQQQQQQQPKRKQSQSVLVTLLTGLVWLVIIFFGASYLITETWTWGYRGKWTNMNTYIPRRDIVFTEQELIKFDGSNPNLPIYLGIDGDVYDVTKGRMWYGYGGSYNHFAGRDAARAYVTGCFDDHLTHDLRGLSDAQLKGVEHWKKFYANHHTYYRVGRVVHDPIDPKSPIPPPCKKSTPQKPSSGGHS